MQKKATGKSPSSLSLDRRAVRYTMLATRRVHDSFWPTG
jgi:hypothetical protein